MIIWRGFRQSVSFINVYFSFTKSKPLDMTFKKNMYLSVKYGSSTKSDGRASNISPKKDSCSLGL